MSIYLAEFDNMCRVALPGNGPKATHTQGPLGITKFLANQCAVPVTLVFHLLVPRVWSSFRWQRTSCQKVARPLSSLSNQPAQRDPNWNPLVACIQSARAPLHLFPLVQTFFPDRSLTTSCVAVSVTLECSRASNAFCQR